MTEQEKFDKEFSHPEKLENIAGRVKNHVVLKTGASLTPVGVQMCNMYTHVLKDLYEFANGLPDGKKAALKALIEKHEDMPANLISVVTPRKKS